MRIGIGVAITNLVWTIASALGVVWSNNLFGSTDANQIVQKIDTPDGVTTVPTNALAFGTGPSDAGVLRFPGTSTAITRRNAAGDGNLAVLAFAAADAMTFGDVAGGVTTFVGSRLSLKVGSTERASIAADGLTLPDLTTGRLLFTSTGGKVVDSGGALTTGQVPRATGAGAVAFGALDLANASAVTGALPFANLATITAVNGVAMPAGGSLTTGTTLRATASGTAAYGALDLANASAVTGLLPFASLATITSVNSVAMPAGGSLTTGTPLRATASGTAAYGALDLANASAVTGLLPFANLATITSVNSVTMPAGGSLTTGTVLRATGAGASSYGALDLANASAVTGILPSANMTASTASVTGGVRLTGDFGGTATAPTVVGLTLGSDAQGDVAYRGASAWARLGAGTSGQALITGGAAANPAWGTNFQGLGLVTTGSYSAGTTPATAGDFRGPNTGTIQHRNAANSGNIQILASDASNGTIVGNGDGIVFCKGSTGVRLMIGAGVGLNVVSGTATLLGANLNFDNNSGAVSILHNTKGSNAATVAMTITSQAPFATATGANMNPGNLNLKVPAAISGGTEGTLALNVKATDILKISHDGTQGTINFASVFTTATPPAGGGVLLPTATGFVTISINGTARQIAYV